MIWIDTSIARSVARALSEVRDDVRWLGDLYPYQHNKDSIWLPDAGNQSALVILRDKRVRTRPAERQLIIEHKVGAFIINQKRNPTKWQYLRLIVGALDEMEAKFLSTARPFIYTVDSMGQLKSANLIR
ncbi:MAG: hypothetical protein O3B84_03655 [Chloroflexi bacterium]|nr:hypothetical protein [Chloroflexota bacterium]